MRTWYRIALIVFVLGAFVPLAAAGTTLVQQATYTARIPAGACEAHPLVPLEDGPADGSAVLRLTNDGEAATARVCFFDGDAAKRLDMMVPMAAGETRDIVVAAPRGVYTFRSEIGGDEGFMASGQGTLTTHWCVSGSADTSIRFHVGATSSGSTASGGSCIPGTLAVGVVGLALSGGSFALGKFPHLGAVLLYSRLARPKLLDMRVRQEVHELVAREPGIHTREIVRALGAADGQIAYHLGVLAREKLLTSVGTPGFRRWFVTGRHSPAQMRAIAALRDPTRRRLYDAIVATPGASLVDVVERAGVSMPQASRASKALERAGLIERTRAGRSLGLRPLHAPEATYAAGRD